MASYNPVFLFYNQLVVQKLVCLQENIEQKLLINGGQFGNDKQFLRFLGIFWLVDQSSMIVQKIES